MPVKLAKSNKDKDKTKKYQKGKSVFRAFIAIFLVWAMYRSHADGLPNWVWLEHFLLLTINDWGFDLIGDNVYETMGYLYPSWLYIFYMYMRGVLTLGYGKQEDKIVKERVTNK